jgi:hypothetical protein
MSFSWSYSKLKNFDVCPKRHYEVDLAKNYSEDQGPDSQLGWGNRVHKALADACKGREALPDTMRDYQHWVDRVQAGPGELMVEQKYALTRDFQPTEYFGPRVWYRGIGDVVRVDGPVALGLDWKTGKILHDSKQLMLLAQCILAYHPDVQIVRTEFVWLKDNCTTPETFRRKNIANEWIGMLDRVRGLEQAAKDMSYPPKPGRLCHSYCPVMSCVYHGKRHS